jgi:hypothetical protein
MIYCGKFKRWASGWTLATKHSRAYTRHGPREARGPHAALQFIFVALGTFFHLEVIVWHCVLTKFKDKIFKICTYFMSKMTKLRKYGKKNFLPWSSFTFKNTFLKNEACTQKYFSNMALEQKSLATPGIYGIYIFYQIHLIWIMIIARLTKCDTLGGGWVTTMSPLSPKTQRCVTWHFFALFEQ